MATRYYWTGSGVTARANSTAYTAGARVVIAPGDTSTNYLVVRRYVLECTTGGTSGAAVPAWSASYTPDTSTITDGTVTWTVRNPGYSSGTTENWTFATIYLAYAISAANTAGDVILAHYTSQEAFSTDVTYTFTANTSLITVDKDNSNALTPMGTNGYIGATVNPGPTITINGYRVFIHGLTWRTAGSGTDDFFIGTANESHLELDNIYFYNDVTASGRGVYIGVTAATQQAYAKLSNCTFRFANTGGGIYVTTARVEFENCVVSSLGSRPATLFRNSDRGPVDIILTACDFSYITGTLVGDALNVPTTYRFSQCKFGANVTVLATQTPANKSSGAAYVFDCSSGDTHGLFGYYDAFGSCVSDTGIYYTTGAAAQSWKIVTTANCSYYTPFTSPFVDFYNTGTSSITPRFEILRDGSTTAFQDDEVWGEFFTKTTSGSTQSTPSSDRMALLGTPANQAAGAGTGSWTGEAASAWSGKVDSGSAVTPAESGHIRGRVVVGEPSITVYVDPQIRTA